jgi:hypothetical protein
MKIAVKNHSIGGNLWLVVTGPGNSNSFGVYESGTERGLTLTADEWLRIASLICSLDEHREVEL